MSKPDAPKTMKLTEDEIDEVMNAYVYQTQQWFKEKYVNPKVAKAGAEYPARFYYAQDIVDLTIQEQEEGDEAIKEYMAKAIFRRTIYEEQMYSYICCLQKKLKLLERFSKRCEPSALEMTKTWQMLKKEMNDTAEWCKENREKINMIEKCVKISKNTSILFTPKMYQEHMLMKKKVQEVDDMMLAIKC